jgi:hypothetical protein
VGGEDRPLCLDGHVGAVRVPTHISLDDLHDTIGLVLGPQAPIGANITDGCEFKFKFAKAPSEAHLLGLTQVLAGKNQQGVPEPERVQGFEVGFVQGPQIEPAHRRPEGCVQLLDLPILLHGPSLRRE